MLHLFQYFPALLMESAALNGNIDKKWFKNNLIFLLLINQAILTNSPKMNDFSLTAASLLRLEFTQNITECPVHVAVGTKLKHNQENGIQECYINE